MLTSKIFYGGQSGLLCYKYLGKNNRGLNQVLKKVLNSSMQAPQGVQQVKFLIFLNALMVLLLT